jgi:hypothetical protein
VKFYGVPAIQRNIWGTDISIGTYNILLTIVTIFCPYSTTICCPPTSGRSSLHANRSAYHLLLAGLVYSSTLKMEAAFSSETSVKYYTSRRRIPGYGTVNNKDFLILILQILLSYAEHVGFVVDKAALGQVFSEYCGFPCQSSFHQILRHHNHPGLTQWAY